MTFTQDPQYATHLCGYIRICSTLQQHVHNINVPPFGCHIERANTILYVGKYNRYTCYQYLQVYINLTHNIFLYLSKK